MSHARSVGLQKQKAASIAKLAHDASCADQALRTAAAALPGVGKLVGVSGLGTRALSQTAATPRRCVGFCLSVFMALGKSAVLGMNRKRLVHIGCMLILLRQSRALSALLGESRMFFTS